MQEKRKEKRIVKYDTDVVVRNTFHNMLRDFRVHLGGQFCSNAERSFRDGGIKTYREYSYPELGIVPPWRFKAYHQMSSLLKKYRFVDDYYSNEALEKETIKKYFLDQERLATKTPHSLLRLAVVQRARAIARQVLGPANLEEVISVCKFGSRSSIGCTLAQAYLDVKLSSRRAFSGSSGCAEIFFKEVVQHDNLMREMVENLGVKLEDSPLCTETLSLTTVPKSWKIYRLITPLSLLGLFLSNGIGAVISSRLAAAGLDIRRLQMRHSRLVKQMSVTLKLATADLSAASDSLTKELLCQILPRDWFSMLRKLFITQVIHKDGDSVRQSHTESVLPMGNGATFPVETLVFYCLLRAIGELSGVKGLISVYGDDLIYPSRLHKFVCVIFPLMNLKLNLDKTFVKHPFRESCGADYYRGVDVRPFFFDGERQLLTRTKYLAFLHKTYNGLCRRWDPSEIRSTLRSLLIEMLRVTDVIMRVPPEYPDTAGIKTLTPTEILLGELAIPYAPIVYRTDNNGNSKVAFRCLQEVVHHRFVVTVLPYYWAALQGDQHFADESVSPYHTARHQVVTWLKTTQVRWYRVGGKLRRKSRVKYLPRTVARTEPMYVVRKGFAFEWI